MSYGRYYDELEAGQSFDHWPGRTITEHDDTLFSLLSLNLQPLHIDEHYSASTQHGRRLVSGPLVIAIAIGMSQRDVGGRATATLEYRNVEHRGPVFHGDTIYASSAVMAKQDGVVSVRTEARNQRGECVLALERRIRVPSR